MNLTNTPLRILVKSYASGLLTRRQYLDIRQRLLHILAQHGQVTDQDLEKLMKIGAKSNADSPRAFKKYSASDWVIIVLGLLAATAMGFILYS
jgi:hypothetical protein